MYTIQVCNRAFSWSQQIPDDMWRVAARCRTPRGAWRRFSEEKALVTHDGGRSWSGHVRVLKDGKPFESIALQDAAERGVRS